MTHLATLMLIRLVVIYPVDSAIRRLNNGDLISCLFVQGL